MKKELQIGEVVIIEKNKTRHLQYGVILTYESVNSKHNYTYVGMFTTLEKAINATWFYDKALIDVGKLESTGYYNNYKILLTL